MMLRVLSVAASATPTLEVDGVDRDVTTCPIGEAVIGVTLVNTTNSETSGRICPHRIR